MKINSIKFEISVLYTAILGLVLLVFSGVLYITSNALLQQSDYQLKTKAQAVDFTIRAFMDAQGPGPGAFMTAVEKTVNLAPFQTSNEAMRKVEIEWIKHAQTLGLNHDLINFVSKEGMTLFCTQNIDKNLRGQILEEAQFSKVQKIVYSTLRYNHHTYRLINYPFNGQEGNRFIIQVATVQDPIMQLMQNWLYSMAVSIPIILILTSFIGRMLANRILEPVREITAMARRITLQDLSARLTAKNFDVEMETLVDAFNDMIARLEKSFKHIEEFSYHVAHELKTPLTIIKGEAELLLRKERTKQEYQNALKITIEETERVLKTVEDLLLLTKLDYQPEVFKFEQFDFIEFIKEIYEQSRILASKKSIKVSLKVDETQFSVMVRGDKLHLRRLFLNIIDNAIKFSPEKGNIQMVVTCVPMQIITSISDTGPGLALKDQPKIFERFYRTDTSPSGNGLGLNIAQTIARIHQGSVTVESAVGQGATFHVKLPTL